MRSFETAVEKEGREKVKCFLLIVRVVACIGDGDGGYLVAETLPPS